MQWVDITGLADGEYVLFVSKYETDNYVPQCKINFENNIVYVLFERNNRQPNSVVYVEFDGSAIAIFVLVLMRLIGLQFLEGSIW